MSVNDLKSINDSPLLFNPVGLNRTYGVIFDVVNGKKSFRINYEIGVKYTGKLNDYYFLFELDRKEVFVNHKLPETLIDQLLAGCGEVIYPLEIISGTSAEFMGINNKKDIIKRWAEKKTALERYYVGEKSDEILDQMDLALSNDRNLVTSVFSDQFVALYFSKVYSLAKKSVKIAFEIFVPVVPFNTAVKYTIEQDINRSLTDNGTIQVSQKGYCSDPRSIEDMAKGMPIPLSGPLSEGDGPLTGDIELNYSLYATDHTINSITGSFTLSTAKGYREVKIQVYHLREKDVIEALADRTAEEPKEEKRRGFFSFFD